MTRQDDNIRKRIESTEKFVPFTPSATSYGMGWKTLQAVRYHKSFARKKGFSGIVLPLANSHFYEAKKRSHDNQIQHLNRSRQQRGSLCDDKVRP
jgi:hypothetical protein